MGGGGGNGFLLNKEGPDVGVKLNIWADMLNKCEL